MEGGMSPAMTEEDDVTAAPKAPGYPSFFCQGISMEPNAEASATEDPETPPKTVEPTTDTCPRPP
ncbi:hypothetical protein HCU01_39630 [Halomonas cupida]|uniref:Uncharacterized protein n=1 Tax=Halomonas cupida TaxID=44933 RepID=A0ABQ0WR51_9GAMM|nr:hypothetical protein HCU01_39630 [Halomonas cupida]